MNSPHGMQVVLALLLGAVSAISAPAPCHAVCSQFDAPLAFATVGESPRSVVAADLNGDGHIDIVSAEEGNTDDYPGRWCVQMGRGDGTFADARAFNGGWHPRSIAVGDLNGDGWLDVAVADPGRDEPRDPWLPPDPWDGGGVLVYLGNGDGTFSGGASYHLGGSVSSVAIGDLNGDGKPDIAVAYMGSGGRVLLGNGDGTFASVDSYPALGGRYAVAIRDLNGDGVPDMVFANGFANSVSVMIGHGDGTFAAAADYATGLEPISLAIADLNADGIPDLVVPSGGYIETTLTARTVSVMLGRGDGTFSPRVEYATGDFPWAVAVGDLNGDGKLDLAVGNSGTWQSGIDPTLGGVTVLLGNGDGTFAPGAACGTGGVSSLAISDANGDGKPDLEIVYTYASTMAVLPGNGDGTFSAPEVCATGAAPSSVAIGDVNGDGMPDIAVANAGSWPSQAGSVSVLLSRSDGTFAPKADYGAGNNSTAVAIGDVTGDDKPDLVVANRSSNTVSVFPGLGGGMFAAKADYPTGPLPSSVAIGDLDGNGKGDLVVADSGSDTVSVFLGGTGGLSPRVDYRVWGRPISIAISDLNGDGTPDLAVACDSTGGASLSVLLGRGDGTFGGSFDHAISRVPTSISIGDLNGDGKPDAAVTVSITGAVSVLLGNGDGTFATATDHATGEDPMQVAIGDVNHDGAPDLAVACYTSGTVSVLFGRRDGTFPTRVDYSSVTDPRSIAIGELSGDADPDLVVSNVGSSTVSVIRNLGCGGVTSSPEPRPRAFAQLEAYPSPFRDAVNVRFAIPEPRRVDAQVFDVTGRRVRSLVNGKLYVAGEHAVVWDRRAENGGPLPGGLYLVRVKAGRDEAVARVVLLR